MNKIQVLDCTLRDGGYCNQWCFGFNNIKEINKRLVDANIDIIECGFLTNRIEYNPDISKYSKLEEIKKAIPIKREGKLFVVMVNYGEYELNDIPENDGSSVDGIRIAFHKKNMNDAIDFCKGIKDKGYLVFIQPMVSLLYSDEEFLLLIKEVNRFNPYAFYIVDSFGMMKEKELLRLFYLVEHNLNEGIWIGFHSHNNIQLSYSNAQKLTTIHTSRNLIIDSSVMGMGRGAGNLNTELFVEYLNDITEKNYKTVPLLVIVDKILTHFYEKKYWGYSLPNYISAIHGAHPNYAGYLDSKKTLTFEDINNIFDMMDEQRKVSFDESYIEELYLSYQERNHVDGSLYEELKNILTNKKVLVVLPGKSCMDEKEKILMFATAEDVITISVNFEYDQNITDYIFISNLSRYRYLDFREYGKCIVTSNIKVEKTYLSVEYKELLNEEDYVKDNAGLMLIKFMYLLGVKELYIAGMDGFEPGLDANYGLSAMKKYYTRDEAVRTNEGIIKVLQIFSRKMSIKFLTKSKKIKI